MYALKILPQAQKDLDGLRGKVFIPSKLKSLFYPIIHDLTACLSLLMRKAIGYE